MKKVIKIISWIVGIVIGVPLLLALTLPLWLGPVVKPTLNTLVPKYTKTDFQIEKLYLNPYTCNFEIGGVTIANPDGFSDPVLAKLGYFNVDVDASTIFSEVIVVDNIEISDIYVTWLDDSIGRNNLDIVQANVSGAEKEYEQEQEKERQRIADVKRSEGVSEAQIRSEEEASRINRKIIVDRFVFKNVSGKIAVPKVGVLPFRVPYDIELKNLGRNSGGLDLDNLRDAVMKEFWASVMASSADFSGMLSKHADKAIDALKDYSGKIKVSDETFKQAADTLKNLFK